MGRGKAAELRVVSRGGTAVAPAKWFGFYFYGLGNKVRLCKD
ncbi:hypothetical protein WN944_027198 [Citrus x changshan-huyou]|uniref:Uncharacterized protein n=1 Tax=Citrus x changshan-huyou TaxID=2935761 RepID=A0AAP0LH50_9ROSI